MSVLNVRLPQSLHDELREIAGLEGVSMNQMVLLAVAEKLAARRVKAQASNSAANTSLRELKAHSSLSRAEAGERLRELLEARADEPPLPGDEISPQLREKLDALRANRRTPSIPNAK